MLHITPQMRILVALEAVDGRNYALPNNMRSRKCKSSQMG
jgi:hypothetical protein